MIYARGGALPDPWLFMAAACLGCVGSFVCAIATWVWMWTTRALTGHCARCRYDQRVSASISLPARCSECCAKTVPRVWLLPLRAPYGYAAAIHLIFAFVCLALSWKVLIMFVNASF